MTGETIKTKQIDNAKMLFVHTQKVSRRSGTARFACTMNTLGRSRINRKNYSKAPNRDMTAARPQVWGMSSPGSIFGRSGLNGR